MTHGICFSSDRATILMLWVTKNTVNSRKYFIFISIHKKLWESKVKDSCSRMIVYHKKYLSFMLWPMILGETEHSNLTVQQYFNLSLEGFCVINLRQQPTTFYTYFFSSCLKRSLKCFNRKEALRKNSIVKGQFLSNDTLSMCHKSGALCPLKGSSLGVFYTLSALW